MGGKQLDPDDTHLSQYHKLFARICCLENSAQTGKLQDPREAFQESLRYDVPAAARHSGSVRSGFRLGLLAAAWIYQGYFVSTQLDSPLVLGQLDVLPEGLLTCCDPRNAAHCLEARVTGVCAVVTGGPWRCQKGKLELKKVCLQEKCPRDKAACSCRADGTAAGDLRALKALKAATVRCCVRRGTRQRPTLQTSPTRESATATISLTGVSN